MTGAGERVRVVVRKEFREYRRKRSILGTTILLPLVFLGVPIGELLSLSSSTPPAAVRALAHSAALMMLLVPIIVPATISAYAVVGEREQGTLEPVLTTPVTERELIIGKAVAAILPAVVLSYFIGAAFGLAVRWNGNPAVVSVVWNPPQVVAQILFAPLLAAWSTWVGMAISARSSDVRVAQQLSSLGSLPMLGLTSLFSFGVLAPTVPLAIAFAVALFVIDSFAWRVVAMMFDRERLISRYDG